MQQTAHVERLIGRLNAEGVSVVLISHNFDQVMRLAKQIWLMRAGQVVATRRAAETTGNELVAFITGADRAV